MDSPANAAIYYIPEGYSTDGDRLMGINAASEGFVRGLARHADIPAAYCVVDDGAAAEAFAGVIQAERPHLPVKALPSTTPALLAEPGCVYLPGPGLSAFAWRRRHLDPRQYSLCGITHTTASAGIMDALADFPIAPIQPWDALICTSRAVRQMVETLIEGQAAYLAERLGATMPPLPHLPVIPLGVDCDRFLDDQASRTAWRDRLGIAPDDVAILFVGRLSFHGKAHPLPLFISLEAAAVRTGRRLHLIMAGWFGSESVETAFKDAARQLCPSVDVLFLDGRETEVRTAIWRAADIFASLADNIQESFGLTPLEAMAAGLPVVASDWDGYRDTVRHGTDGFLIQSLMAPAPLGGDLADRHASGLTNYDRYIGEVAQFTALDLNACTAAFTALIDDADLRRRMGAAGRERARRRFDWRVVIGQYQALWAELGHHRAAAAPVPPVRDIATIRPARPDPFHAFAGYPSRRLDAMSLISLVPGGRERLLLLRPSPMIAFAEPVLPAEDEAAHILMLLEKGPSTVESLMATFPLPRRGIAMRGIVWLAKFGIVAIV
ncbi:MAG: glycosyl transferase-like protein [Rhodospirillales bacterium]|nr:glycosyl transferase-like protein [Rhodospirillales bacterium]